MLITYEYNDKTDKRRCTGLSTVITLEESDCVKLTADTEEELYDLIHKTKYENDEKYKVWYDEEMEKPLSVETKVVAGLPQYGCISLVGISGTAPVSWGNYFGVYVDGREYSVINIWYENLVAASTAFNIDEFEYTIINSKAVIVKSPNIPKDWYIEDFFMKYNCSLNSVEKQKVREQLSWF